MTYGVSTSSLSSSMPSSTSSGGSFNASSVSSQANIKMKKIWKNGPKDSVGIIASFLSQIHMLHVLKNVKAFKGILKTEYSKTLEVFKTKIGIQKFSGILATATDDLKRVIFKKATPDANDLKKISDNKTLLTKRIFCDLFEKITLMHGDGFLRRLFPNEDITSASKVIDYSINPDVLEKMHQWVEDKNLIKMMKSIAEQYDEVSEAFEGQNLLAYINSASLKAVHTRAQSFRSWINDNSNVLLNITELDFDELGLTVLPSEIDKFINLQTLNLVENNLTQLPDTIGNLGNLQVLNLSNNHITHLPNTIGNLGNLQVLNLYNNYLTQLPDTFGNLGHLQYLYLSDNHLTQLPHSIGNLRNLQVLNLYNNYLTQLPDTFGNLGNLQRLDIENNDLTRLSDMTNLFENVRQEIFKNSSLKARISYYLELPTFCSPC